MSDQSLMLNNPPQVISHRPQLMMKQPPQVQILSQPQPNAPIMSQSQFMMNQSQQAQGIGQPQMMKQRSYNRMWQPQHQTSMDMVNFSNPNPNSNPMKQQGFVGSKPRNWKGKKGNDKRRKEKPVTIAGSGGGSSSGLFGGGGGGYKPPTLNELQHQNRIRARKFYPKKKYISANRFAPYAPRNTTSFIIRAKKSGGIASLVSPCPVTPAVLPTPIFSPSREVLGDMAKEEWGVDGYGSMKGLIRLRNEADGHEDEEEEEVGSSESDVEEHVEVERRLDHDLSRFEMIYPNYGVDYNNVLENRVDDQDSHIAQLEEENLILKERLFLVEREFGDLRRRLQYLERQRHRVDVVNELVENVSENESEGNNEELVEENNEEGEEVDAKEQHNNEEPGNTQCVRDVCMAEHLNAMQEVIDGNLSQDGGVGLCGNGSVCVEEFAVAQKEATDENQSKGDVCMAECLNAKQEVTDENLSQDGGVGLRGNGSVCVEEFVVAQKEATEENQSKGEVVGIRGDDGVFMKKVDA